MAEMTGKKAPDFTLPDQDEEEVSLSGFRGRWVVLYFYPKDNTPGCTTEACEFTAALPDFKGLDAVVLGVSPDSPKSHRNFREKHDITIPLLSDPDKEVLERYGAYGEKKMYGKVSKGVIRSTLIIDPDGVVRAHWPRVKVKGHVDEVRETLEELQG